jgi:signal transduction histidine kinase
MLAVSRLYGGVVRDRRADLTWAPLLVLSAGLSLVELLTAGSGWLPLLMIVLAYPAGRRMASLSLALWVFTVVAFAGLALAFWRSPGPLSDWLELAMREFLSSVLPWWVGRYRRLHAEHREREHGIVAEQARLRERARIAQDMHDSLGHELALIALHSGALELAVGLTDDQRRTVGELRAGAVRATHRLHEIVRVLGSADAAAELRPADEGIDGLVRRAAAAGLRVRLRHDGPGPTWSPMTSQAAHRVVQESLTNVARHAPDATVTVTVARQDTDTRIDVVNDAPSQPNNGHGHGTGHGLIALHERIRLVGGRLDAGPRPDGGWAVTAELPDGAGPRPGDDGSAGFELRLSTRLTRRRLRQTAALPFGIGLALVAGIFTVHGLAVARTGLADDRYDELRLGLPRPRLEPLLPSHDVGEVPSVLAEPPRPAGATCVYYQAGTSLIRLDPDFYRLCFADGVLVSKHRLTRA